ncbi:glycosyltransferase family 39 protein [Hymenobacter coalescens]
MRWAVLGVVLGVGLFARLDAPEIGLMEARNFVAAREIHAGGSWLLPTMNGELRLAKPPLPTWLVAVVMHLTGTTTDLGLLRLPSAVGACLLVLCFQGLARRLTPPADRGRTAWLAAVVLGSSLLLLTAGRDGNGWDIYCYTFMVGAVLALLRGLQGPVQQGWGWFGAAGSLIGLSMLSKGPVGPYGMLLPFLMAYALRGDRAALRRHWRGLLLMVGVGTVVGGTWPLYVLSQHLNEAAEVAQAESGSWSSRHVKSLWFYLNFPAFMGLWALASVATLIWPYAAMRIRAYAPYGLLLAWVVATLVLLSLVPEKKERYLLPVLPPLALLTAALLRYWLSAARRTPADRWLLRGWVVILLTALLAVPAALPAAGLRAFPLHTGPYWVVTIACLLLVAVAGLLWRRGQLAVAAVGGSLGAVLVASGLLMPVYPEWQRRRDDPGLRPLAQVVRERSELRRQPLYSLGEMQIKWIWAAGRVVPEWNLATDSVPLRQLPLFLYAPVRGAAPFPPGWVAARGLQVTTVDSFDLSHQFADGRWYVTKVYQNHAR